MTRQIPPLGGVQSLGLSQPGRLVVRLTDQRKTKDKGLKEGSRVPFGDIC